MWTLLLAIKGENPTFVQMMENLTLTVKEGFESPDSETYISQVWDDVQFRKLLAEVERAHGHSYVFVSYFLSGRQFRTRT